MKCKKCPVGLACWADRLKHGPFDMYLCPICKQLVVTTRDNLGGKRYCFLCEIRKITQEILQKWSAFAKYAIDDRELLWIRDPKNKEQFLAVSRCRECIYSWQR